MKSATKKAIGWTAVNIYFVSIIICGVIAAVRMFTEIVLATGKYPGAILVDIAKIPLGYGGLFLLYSIIGLCVLNRFYKWELSRKENIYH